MNYTLSLTKRATKDSNKINRAGFGNKVYELIKIILNNPYQNPPPFEKLKGDLLGLYARRINSQHRLVYQINEIKIVSMWSHYEYQ